MKYLILIVAIAFVAFIVHGQKDPGQVASECKDKYKLSDAEEKDIQDKVFNSTSTISKQFFECFCIGTGYVNSTGDLNATAFRATANGDQKLLDKINICLTSCTSKSTDRKTKIWELSRCYFYKLKDLMSKS